MCSHKFAVVNSTNNIMSCNTTKLKNVSTPHGEILDPPLDIPGYLGMDLLGQNYNVPYSLVNVLPHFLLKRITFKSPRLNNK